MDLHILVNSLDKSDKEELLGLLAQEITPLNTAKLTSIPEFIEQNEGVMSERLKNILSNDKYYLKRYVETLTPKEIMCCRNAGKKTVKEFIKLRGFGSFGVQTKNTDMVSPKTAKKAKCITDYAGGHPLHMLTVGRVYDIIHNPHKRRDADHLNDRDFAIIDNYGKKRYYKYRNPSGVWEFIKEK